MKLIAAFACALAVFASTAPAHAQVVVVDHSKAAFTVHHLHAILRPDGEGGWYIQNDVDHASIGISTFIEQTDEYIRIFFNQTYDLAGASHISSDDGFGQNVTGHAELGRGNATIKIFKDGKQIPPPEIADKNSIYLKNGNFWITVTMLERADVNATTP